MLIIYVDNFLFGQNTGDYSNKTGISSLLKVNTGSSEQYNQAIKGIRRSIDEEQYTIDTGDEFLVKIDIPGPEIQTITVPVLSDGYILITESEGIYIRGMKLKDAKKTITEHLKRYLPNALTECYLNAIHPVKVSIKGALEINQLPEFTSADRISDIIDFVYGTYKQDTLLLDILKSASLRNISVIRNDTTILFDYLIYKSSNKQVNQYLKDNDVIFIPYKDTCGFTIQVDGI
jgi:protein involved in polysaccharide export with SLBB domain